MTASHPISENMLNILAYCADKSPEFTELMLDIDRYIRPLANLELPEEDGIPMETNWHRSAMNLLIDSVHAHWHDRNDYFAGGNMFIHYSLEQVLQKDFIGPDFFVVKGVDGTRDRKKWTVWEEGGRYPNVILELSSPSTIKADFGKKKEIYEHIFRMPEYFCYTPDTQELHGWKLVEKVYVPMQPDEQGRLWSAELSASVGLWEGEFQRIHDYWPRLYHSSGELVLTLAEAEAQRAEAEAQRAEAEAQRAEAEAQRADSAETEIARLKALLAEHGIAAESPS